MNIEDFEKSSRRGKTMAGLILVVAGTLLLLNQMGYYIPDWLTSWPMFLIVLALYLGVKHGFRKPGWIIVFLVGMVFLMDKILVGMHIGQFIWPAVIIGAGLYMVLNRKSNRWAHKDWPGREAFEKGIRNDSDIDDSIESVAVFGGFRKKISSKNFRGGELVCIFSGAELDLSQAEFSGRITLELTNVFGGTKLIIPANWEIKSEIVAIFGGIEDKRPQQAQQSGNENVLMIRGTSIMGGIEIKSY